MPLCDGIGTPQKWAVLQSQAQHSLCRHLANKIQPVVKTVASCSRLAWFAGSTQREF